MNENDLVHRTAIVHHGAVLGEGTRVGAFSIIGDNVVLGRNCDVQEHVILRGPTTIGDDAKIFPHAVIGGDPQHNKYKGEHTRLEIGNRVTLRECVTANRGTEFGGSVTRIGDDSHIMAYCHVGHDAQIGKRVILANSVQIAGHVEVHDEVFIGGLSAIPQFLRVGRNSYIGGGSLPRKDIPPFLLGKGMPYEPQGINVIGLERIGFTAPMIKRLRSLYRIIFMRKLTLAQAIETAQTELGDHDEVNAFLKFVGESKTGIVR